MNRVTLRLAAAYFCLQLSANAELLNVSQIVTGSNQAIDWNIAANKATVAAAATITYNTMGHATLKPAPIQDMVGPGPWGTGWKASQSTPNLTLSVPTAPVNKYGQVYNYSSNTFRSASSNMTLNPRYTGSMAFSTGAAEAVTSYSYKIEHYGAAQDYFLNIQHPTFQRTVDSAYTLTPGSNGGTYIYTKPTNANSRATVEIYADGLPVWSSESSYQYPKGQATYAWDNVGTNWGKASAAGFSTLYLGKLNAGSTVILTMVVRTAVNVEMSTSSCPLESSAWENVIRCHKVTDAVKLSNLPSYTSMLQIFTKVL
ncbi:MAG: hypothetical protein U0R19_17760 [Bryobacteraceae bacterium]